MLVPDGSSGDPVSVGGAQDRNSRAVLGIVSAAVCDDDFRKAVAIDIGNHGILVKGSRGMLFVDVANISGAAIEDPQLDLVSVQDFCPSISFKVEDR